MRVVNTHFPGVPTMPGVRALFCAVLVQDDRGGYAVYTGLVKDRSERSVTWVQDRGSKLRYKDALTHFPCIREKDYRG